MIRMRNNTELLPTETQHSRNYLDPVDPLYESHCLGLREGLMLGRAHHSCWGSEKEGVAAGPARRGERGASCCCCCWRAGKLPWPGWDLGACPCLWPGKPCSCPGSFAGDCHFSSLVPLACLEPALITRIKRKAKP